MEEGVHVPIGSERRRKKRLKLQENFMCMKAAGYVNKQGKWSESICWVLQVRGQIRDLMWRREGASKKSHRVSELALVTVTHISCKPPEVI